MCVCVGARCKKHVQTNLRRDRWWSRSLALRQLLKCGECEFSLVLLNTLVLHELQQHEIDTLLQPRHPDRELCDLTRCYSLGPDTCGLCFCPWAQAAWDHGSFLLNCHHC